MQNILLIARLMNSRRNLTRRPARTGAGGGMTMLDWIKRCDVGEPPYSAFNRRPIDLGDLKGKCACCGRAFKKFKAVSRCGFPTAGSGQPGAPSLSFPARTAAGACIGTQRLTLPFESPNRCSKVA